MNLQDRCQGSQTCFWRATILQMLQHPNESSLEDLVSGFRCVWAEICRTVALRSRVGDPCSMRMHFTKKACIVLCVQCSNALLAFFYISRFLLNLTPAVCMIMVFWCKLVKVIHRLTSWPNAVVLNLFESKALPTGKHNEEHGNNEFDNNTILIHYEFEGILLKMKKLLSFKLHVQKLGVIIHYNKQ